MSKAILTLEDLRKKAQEEALKQFPDYEDEKGHTVNCCALRWNFVFGYESGYEEAAKKIREMIWWAHHNMSFEQGFDTGDAEHGYKSALEDFVNQFDANKQ